MIETHLACDVVEKRNGQEALDTLRGGFDPELLVCDVRMPVMDGLTFLQHLRRDADLKHHSVLLCSTVHDRATITEAARYSIAGYVLKPFETPTLVNKLSELLRSKEQLLIDGGIDALRLDLGVAAEELPEFLNWLIKDLQQVLEGCSQAQSPAELRYRLFYLHALSRELRARTLQHTIEDARRNLALDSALLKDVIKPVHREGLALIDYTKSLQGKEPAET